MTTRKSTMTPKEEVPHVHLQPQQETFQVDGQERRSAGDNNTVQSTGVDRLHQQQQVDCRAICRSGLTVASRLHHPLSGSDCELALAGMTGVSAAPLQSGMTLNCPITRSNWRRQIYYHAKGSLTEIMTEPLGSVWKSDLLAKKTEMNCQ